MVLYLRKILENSTILSHRIITALNKDQYPGRRTRSQMYGSASQRLWITEPGRTAIDHLMFVISWWDVTLARYKKIPSAALRLDGLPFSLPQSFPVVELFALIALVVFIDQGRIGQFDGIALFFAIIHSVVLQDEADFMIFAIGKGPFPGVDDMKGISAVLIGLAKLLLKSFEQFLVELFA